MAARGVDAFDDGALIRSYRIDMERRALSPGTIAQVQIRLRAFALWLDPQRLCDATADDVEEFLDSRMITGRPISARTRAGWLTSLHCYYRWALRHRAADHDPTIEIVRPRLRRTLPRPVSDDELVRALDSAWPEMRAWLTLAAFAGLRCAEIAGVDRTDVLDDDRLLRVLGKGHKERIVPMHPLVVDALAPFTAQRRGHIFTHPNGGPWTPKRLSRTGAVYLSDIGIDATMHQFRHWFGTNTYARCKDIRVVQELMGHSSPTTTAIYTAFSRADAAAAVHALPDLTAA